MQRRAVLELLGLAAASLATPAAWAADRGSRQAAAVPRVRGPIPLPSDGLSAAEQRRAYAQITLEDRLVLPSGYRADLLAVWGDSLGAGRFGFNNDHLAFTPLEPNRGVLTVNFEYISPIPWRQGFSEAIGQELPFDALLQALEPQQGKVDLATLAADAPLRQLVLEVARAAMADLGIGVIEIQRDAKGQWHRQPGRLERRVTGLTGLEDPDQRLRVSGPAALVFRRRDRLGYDDGLGDRVIGTFANCSGGQTPWGTVLSAEENVQSQVVEAVHADGSSPSPSGRPFAYDGTRLDGLGNPFGLAGNKYGWMVELDPRRPDRPAVKHSWLGRCRHEAVAVRAVAKQPLIVYSGCDRLGGHVYRFVSDQAIVDPRDPANSALFEAGRLEVARFNADGSGNWIPLTPQAPIAPVPPSHFRRFGVEQATLVPHSDRGRAGAEALASDGEVNAYRQRYRTLADLYPGGGATQMGSILIDAHLAANAVGATPAARPEDTDLDPSTGDLLIAFTAGGGNEDGRADPAIFHGPRGQATWPYGWVMRLQDAPASPQPGGTFRWRMVATGGAPWQGGLGFANPDNLAIDRAGHVWMVTDRSTKAADLDLFGPNSCWVLPQGQGSAGEAFCFALGPAECELTGPCFDADDSTLFLSVQHPGEDHGCRRDGAREAQAHQLRDRAGQPFEQLRWVPLGSNWPSGVPGRAPRPGVVAIRRSGGGPLLPSLVPPA